MGAAEDGFLGGALVLALPHGARRARAGDPPPFRVGPAQIPDQLNTAKASMTDPIKGQRVDRHLIEHACASTIII